MQVRNLLIFAMKTMEYPLTQKCTPINRSVPCQPANVYNWELGVWLMCKIKLVRMKGDRGIIFQTCSSWWARCGMWWGFRPSRRQIPAVWRLSKACWRQGQSVPMTNVGIVLAQNSSLSRVASGREDVLDRQQLCSLQHSSWQCRIGEYAAQPTIWYW